MCGISGSYAPDGRIDRSIPVAMHDRLRHRGPDETYSLDTPSLSAKLGRLAMVGVVDGWQPAEDVGGRFVALTNGEIYNAPSLRAGLPPDRTGNGVDVSVVPELMAQEGPAGLRRIDGQFASVLYDREECALYLARDRFGICPLHYVVLDGRVHFCSELKALVQALAQPWRIDLTAVDQYLGLGNVVAPRTLVEGVQAVEPACVVRFDATGVRTERYWRYGEFAPDGAVSDEDLRQGLRDSLAARLRADVEIGAYLSGGFDSSALVLEAAALQSRPVRSFSVGFDDPALDEGRFQREVAAVAGTKHEEVRCGRADVAARFEEVVRHCCFPQRETYNVAALMLSERVSAAGLRGVVSGEGADELFFGYDSYAFDSAARRPRPSREENEHLWGRPDFAWEVDWDRVTARRLSHLSPAAREALEGREFWRSRLIPLSDGQARELTPMQLRSVADIYVQLAGHLLGDHGDAMVMANSVEGRYPFLGNSVVALALRVPDQDKVVDFEGKACLRRAYRGLVPDAVLDRAKHGFTAYDLAAVTDARVWERWRELIVASGLLDASCLDGGPSAARVEKWDHRLSVISLALIIDELGLQW
ncbi:MAG TPA: asparagine synthase (glutamine-hydrolyzing) [Kineosporiaceae bacterium]